jgi:hypothetical protein
MADRNTPTGGKGVFGHARLKVAEVYRFPSGRRRVILIGGALVASLLLFALFDLSFGGAEFVSSGTLSSSHATLDPGESCNNCHSPLAGVVDSKCETCHERFDDPVGTFSFASHKAVARTPELGGDSEVTNLDAEKSDCADCHLEHKGRLASITDVANSNCQLCHNVDSFEDDHPEFDHARLALREPAGLIFTHIRHVRRLVKRENGIDTAEAACGSCHQLKDGAKNFEPLSFDENCYACHLGKESETEAFTIAKIPASGVQSPTASIGVETLASIRKRAPLGSGWASNMSARGFTIEDGAVTKHRVEHADPWILHNLALLRNRLREPGLADLLASTPQSAGGYTTDVYREAIASLDQMNTALAGAASEDDDEIREEVNRIREKIHGLRSRVDDPNEDLDSAAFAARKRTDVSDDLREQILDFSATVGDACWKCHEGSEAGIIRPQIEQRELLNARFDHGAHVVQRDCLDCHTEIPIAKFAYDDKKKPPKEQASIINIPGVSNCQECHTAKLASDQCVGCHDYHPHQEGRARFVVRDGDATEAGSASGAEEAIQ